MIPDPLPINLVYFPLRDMETGDRYWDCIYPVAKLIDLYYEDNPAGGTLHIVLSDLNMDDSCVQFCMAEALKAKDWIGYAIANMLMVLTEEERLRAKQDSQYIR